jgi:LuxR family maltose regulon positive regulatory protein
MKWQSVDETSPRIASAKLAPPRGVLPILSRGRLALNADGSLPRFTLVRAPAGFGKTTLMQQWHDELVSLDWDVAWITLDSGDNAIARLSTHLLEALDRFVPPSPDQFDNEREASLKAIIQRIQDTQRRFVLMLDEIETLTSGDAFDVIARIARIDQPNFAMIVSGRTIPPIGQARISLSSNVLEITDADLRFNAEESQALFAKRLGASVTKAQANVLGRHLDGWAAGLQFACLALRGHGDVAGFVDHAVTHKMISDYLREDIFNKLSEDVREFLLSVSPFKVLTGGLCDAVTGRNDSEGMLGRSRKQGSFKTDRAGEQSRRLSVP